MTFDFLNDDIVIICEQDVKLKIIEIISQNNKIYNIKYLNIKELVEALTFSYDNKTIVKVMNEFNLSYENAKMFLDNIKYVGFEESKDERIKYLENVKNYCLENKLLKYNLLLKNNIINKKIFFVGYNLLDKFTKFLLQINNINYELIKNSKFYEVTNVYEFNTANEEINFVANKILDLLNDGININKIFIANVNDDYDYLINRIFKLYKIPYNRKKHTSIYETEVGFDFLNNLNSDIQITIQYIKNKYNNEDILNMIVSILNKFSFINDYTLYKDLLISEFKRAKLKETIYENAVNRKDISSLFSSDEYVFLIGFNLKSIPLIYKDEEYVTDNIKFSFMDTSDDKNIREKENSIYYLKTIPNLTISYKLAYLQENFYPSILIDELSLETKKEDTCITEYSDLVNKIDLAKLLDDYYKYGNISCDLHKLLFNYNNEFYNTYDNKFKGLSNFKKDITLSYSSMNNYYKCAFRYYLANVLKIDIYNENFSQYIGNLFHYCLQNYFETKKDILELYEEYLKNNYRDLSEKEKYFIEELKTEISDIVKIIEQQYTHSIYKEALYEKEIVVEFDNNKFKGFVDKILYNNNKYVIIDYKTGSIDVNLCLVPYGLSMQLPVYLYLVHNYNNDGQIVGFYLQHIINPKIRKENGKTEKEIKKNNLKLQGYTLGNEFLISEFDDTYENSEIIKGLKLGKNGFYSKSNVISETQINNLISLTEQKIKEALDNIEKANFDINPKVVGKNNGCDFCKFKDICFMSEKDKVYLEEIKDLSFLE